MGGPGGSPSAAGAGRPSRTGALHHLPVLPPGVANRDVGWLGVLYLLRDAARPANVDQSRHLHSGNISRHVYADHVREEPDLEAPTLDQTGISRRARPAVD